MTRFVVPAIFIGLGLAGSARATTDDFWTQGQLLVKTSLYTVHYSNDPRHNNDQRMINLEWIAADDYSPRRIDRSFARAPQTRWLAGVAAFRNSFGQDSTYLYGGFRYELASRGSASSYLKLTAGALHGYRGEFRNKIPLNQLGVAPAILPAIGVDFGRTNIELIPFGAAGLMLSVGVYAF